MISATLLSSIFLLPIPFILLFFFLSNQNRHLPPGPKPLPIIGNLHQLGGSSWVDSLQQLSKQYGPFMYLHFGSIGTLVISSADAAREAFRAHDITFSGRPAMYVANKLTYNCNDISFAPYGPAWRQSRKVAILELLSVNRVQSFDPIRSEEIELLVDRIARFSGGNRPVNLNKLAMMLANNIVSRATFGKKFDGDDEDGGSTRFERVLHENQEMLTEFNLADCFPWMKWINRFNGVNTRLDKVCGELDELFEEMIAEHLEPKRRRRVGGQDMLDLLLRVHKDPNHQNRINMQQVKGILLDMFIAGTDTSAATIVWLMAELIKNPTKMKKAQEEIRASFKGKPKVEESDLHKLNYLKAAIKETMRLHTPVPQLLPRETTGNCTIHGYEIPAGTRVIIDARAIGTDPKTWEEPGEFQPERFLDSLVDFKGQHFELIPFGVGRRICPGISFAIVVVELAVANLLGRFDWSLPQGMTTEDVDMEEVFALTAFKKTPLSLIAKRVDLFKETT